MRRRSLRLSLRLKLIQRDRAVTGVHGQSVSAAIDFAAYVVVAEAAFDGDRNVGGDTAVAGVEFDVRRQISRDSE